MFRLRVHSFVVTLVLAGALFATFVGAGPEARTTELPLGVGNLAEVRATQQVTSGVTYTRIVRGEISKHDYFTIFIFANRPEQASQLAARLRADGHDPHIEVIAHRAFDDPQPGPLGWRVTVGQFDTMNEANALRDALAAKGYTLL